MTYGNGNAQNLCASCNTRKGSQVDKVVYKEMHGQVSQLKEQSVLHAV
eukprot:CAMPEP_0119114864 /NCGR_PEP_ID=MMETSP1180-20130426/48898_1 /TAXON_ID=3052 ORGANISM="Chlamydomonas cf sp, Strain CCMP681" /NCGR_SAMPLE_ID=MMETSP1180 /ASSEMBLY_ACC=CAM_ASM_000741 /LENGTH=47 /DNA_ID= /DNA_START= /DNA_END= /DNA_ORIENTATION=